MIKIAVIGAGTMGNGIAHVFASENYKVNLIDFNSENLQQALINISSNLDRQIKKEIINQNQKTNCLNNITLFNDLNNGLIDVELVIEAITENEKIKLDLFKKLNSFCSKTCILASNTSSISISKLSDVVANPERVIGMHFMNPVPVMKLVEIIKGNKTSNEITNTIVNICHKINKIPVVVNDAPGFIANRILMPMINEAVICLEQKVAGVAEIDEIMKLGMAHPMGPLQLADLIGIDVCYFILNVLHQELGDKYQPAATIGNLVKQGKLGMKSKKGFYDYSHSSKELIVSQDFK